MSQVLFYADTRSLAAYLGGAALLESDLAAVSCEDLVLQPAEGNGGAPVKALYFADPINSSTSSRRMAPVSLSLSKAAPRSAYTSIEALRPL